MCKILKFLLFVAGGKKTTIIEEHPDEDEDDDDEDDETKARIFLHTIFLEPIMFIGLYPICPLHRVIVLVTYFDLSNL